MSFQPELRPILPSINLIPAQEGCIYPIIPIYSPLVPIPIQNLQPEAKPKYKRTWKRNQVEALYAFAKLYCAQNGKSLENLQLPDFIEIAKSTDKTAEQCRVKLHEIHASGSLRSGTWSEVEDGMIKDMALSQKLKWGQIASQVNSKVHKNMKIRTGKQCKERWNNHLNPHVNRGEWTAVEDLKLLELHKEHKNHWSLISKEMTTRTESAIKNRIKSLMNKEMQDVNNINNPSAAVDRLIMKKKIEISNLKDAQDNASPGSGSNYSRATMKQPTFSDLAMGLFPN
ncbi:unnamed protein product [Blepharisma stoltei]|uniref:Uncharacterized protein n=1 Tax=Blepharisma stoltei TaxID=1481888 RepID=A0AAU9ITF0_9CILI|nr:unnamed protein product [Blepharisma stoltei]